MPLQIVINSSTIQIVNNFDGDPETKAFAISDAQSGISVIVPIGLEAARGIGAALLGLQLVSEPVKLEVVDVTDPEHPVNVPVSN